MTQTYKGIEISYNESTNEWTFTLRGRDRSVESLAKAKEAIDRPAQKGKTNFKSIQVWESTEYGSRYSPAIITGVAARGRYDYGGTHVWVSANGNRSKGRLSDYVLDSPENNAAIAEINSIFEQIKTLREKANARSRNLTKVVIPDEGEELAA